MNEQLEHLLNNIFGEGWELHVKLDETEELKKIESFQKEIYEVIESVNEHFSHTEEEMRIMHERALESLRDILFVITLRKGSLSNVL